jgi:hypothetical protein
MDNDAGFIHFIDTVNGDNTLASSDKVIEITKKEYSVSYLGEKLEPVVKKLIFIGYDKSFFKAFRRYSLLLMLGIIEKLKKITK